MDEPAATAAEPAAEPATVAPAASPAPRASRLGGALLILGVLAVLAVVLVLVLGGGDDDEPSTAAQPTAEPAPTASATPDPAAQAQLADEITLRPPGGGDARGAMTVFLQQGQLQFQILAENVPTTGQRFYAVWLTRDDGAPRRLGFAQAAEDGTLGLQGPSASDAGAFPRLYATFDRVVVSQETTDGATEPTRVVLTGPLPAGR